MKYSLCLGILFSAIYSFANSNDDSQTDSQTDSLCIHNGKLVEQIQFSGLKTTQNQIVIRELYHKINMPFRCSEWVLEKGKLESLDLFSSIELFVSDSVHLNYIFKELPPYIPFIAINKTDQDGWSAGPSLTSLNFLGNDIRLEALARFGGTTEAQISASSPYIGMLPLAYDVALIWVDSYNDLRQYQEQSLRIKSDFNFPILSSSPFLRAILSAEYFQFQSSDSLIKRNLLSWDRIPSLGAGFSIDTRNQQSYTKSGLYQEFRYTRSGKYLGGDGNYGELLSDSRFWFPFGNRLVIHGGNLLQFRPASDTSDFRRYELFYLGGANSLRGASEGELIGASEWIFFLENRYSLLPRKSFSVAKVNLFIGLEMLAGLEWATAWTAGNFSKNQISSCYLGMHFLLPGINRLRMELGSKITRVQLQLDQGIFEKTEIQRFRTR